MRQYYPLRCHYRPLVEKSKRDNCTEDELPLILGLRSMQDRNAVLEMSKGKEVLTFLGPGGYIITWSPGTVHIPLSTAMSGHLMAPCVEYSKVPKSTGGVDTATNTVHATPTRSHPAGQSASGKSGIIPHWGIIPHAQAYISVRVGPHTHEWACPLFFKQNVVFAVCPLFFFLCFLHFLIVRRCVSSASCRKKGIDRRPTTADGRRPTTTHDRRRPTTTVDDRRPTTDAQF